MVTYEKKKLKYEAKDTELVFKTIRERADVYFATSVFKKNANGFMWVKSFLLCIIVGFAYFSILHIDSLFLLVTSYLLLGFSFLTLGINVGHDAAHHCLTGRRKVDNVIFQLVFGLQGMCGYLWQLRHNFSHHIFPNINENDTDLDLTPLLLINKHQKVYWFHKYQHIYATFLYGFFSLMYIFVQDFISFSTKEHGNLKIIKIPFIEWVKLVLIKVTYVSTFILIPAYYTNFTLSQILLVFFLMHFLLSIYLSFTFFISHHVSEVEYYETSPNENIFASSWVKHQIISTIDFNPENKVANFLFGGFNLHIAHHIFPEVSHAHYPELTRIIQSTLKEHNLNWYKSFTFFEGVASHLRHLKNRAAALIHEDQINGDQSEDLLHTFGI